MMSFLIYTGVAIWAFAARRFGRACLTLLVIGVAGLLLAMVPR
ncbi:hypothetical protein [Sphingobium sp.]